MTCSFPAGTHWFHVVLKRACDADGAGGQRPRYTAHLLDPTDKASFEKERVGNIYRTIVEWCSTHATVLQGSDDWGTAYRAATGAEQAPSKQNDNHSCGWYAILAVAHAAGQHTDTTTIPEAKAWLFEEELAARSGAEAGDNDSDSSDGVELVE